MAGTRTPTSRAKALDQARQLLARAKAQKATTTPAPPPPDPTPQPTVTSFDPDFPYPSNPHADLTRLGSVHAGSSDLDPTQLGSEGAEVRLTSVSGVSGAGGTRIPSAQRVQQALDTAEVDRDLPTHPAVSGLLAGASLRGGSVYSVRGSAALVMALMAGPSADGAWCGVVGIPSFGAEAAHGFGVDLERLVLVPHPGPDWLSVVAALVDALTVVVVRPPGEVTPGEASRLAARLRTRGAMLIASGSWPGSEARFEIESSTWTGLGAGEGLLTARRATVAVTGRRAATPTRHHLWLPAPDGTIHPATPTETPNTTTWPEQIEAVG
ncbi:hypothetical protein PWY87_02335 [Kribbella solani]|uniref:hypothetical protein n=1 Tax=Kribbella solani TaxID=236067 RepID=UPI0029A4F530|nr:hypothetical protein [Kribbella solani]MDX3000491.1 hypothetical protein [Kribbella solani]